MDAVTIDIAATTDAVMSLIEGSGIGRDEAERAVRAMAPQWRGGMWRVVVSQPDVAGVRSLVLRTADPIA